MGAGRDAAATGAEGLVESPGVGCFDSSTESIGKPMIKAGPTDEQVGTYRAFRNAQGARWHEAWREQR